MANLPKSVDTALRVLRDTHQTASKYLMEGSGNHDLIPSATILYASGLANMISIQEGLTQSEFDIAKTTMHQRIVSEIKATPSVAVLHSATAWARSYPTSVSTEEVLRDGPIRDDPDRQEILFTKLTTHDSETTLMSNIARENGRIYVSKPKEETQPVSDEPRGTFSGYHKHLVSFPESSDAT